MKKIAVLSLLLIFLTSFAFAGTVELPKTGQTKCYDTAGNAILCPGTGQDGEIQAGVAWPDPRFTDNNDGTMTDNLTGLMWTKNANLPGGKTTWWMALDYCNNLTLGDYSDWRLPNVNELESLVNANEQNSATWLNAQGFTNVQASPYWSSTTHARYTNGPWVIYIWAGYVSYGGSGSYCYVWPVRCGENISAPAQIWKTGQTTDGYLERGVAWPSPRFADHGNGTVTDNLTGLMWTKDANLPNGYMYRQQALNYVAGMNSGAYPNYGYYDWRLPNRKELFSLIDHSRYGPALPADHPFTNVQMHDDFDSNPYYWSSTTIACSPGSPWVVSMWSGLLSYDNVSSGSYYVWPVRGPDEPTLITLSSFTATPSDRAVILTWTTESEIDNAGFNLYRAESGDGEYVKINDSLIPAKGSPTQGATYQFIDENVKNRAIYYYKLEDIDLSGKSTMHGPVSAVPRRLGRD